jgi:uncharacterized protein (TIGR00369 family)
MTAEEPINPPIHPFARWLGHRTIEQDGEFAIEIDMRPEICNGYGMLQGGVTATLADLAGGILAARVVAPRLVATLDLNIRYLDPGRVGPIRATGRLLRRGRSTVVTSIEVIDVGADRLMAHSTMTSIILPEVEVAPRA